MKKSFLFILFLLGTMEIFSQGMIIDRHTYALDAGFGVMNINGKTGAAYNFGISISGIFDLGVTYSKASAPDDFKSTEGITGHMDFHMIKDSLFGLALNLAMSNMNNQSAILTGSTIYGRFKLSDISHWSLYPSFSAALLTGDEFALGLGFGLSVEYGISKNISLVLTPGAAGSPENFGYLITMDFVLKI
ncbi:MAG: hypothetical protein IPJ03_14850 [Ignavibacteriales bacterium]|nr:hypothetical protein [Ignavibacteriales bacterium]